MELCQNLRNLFHACKFSKLTINLSEVWLSQIFDLGKQFTLMIRLENTFARRLKYVLETSSKRLEERCLEDVFTKRLEDSWRCMAKKNILVLIKTSWRLLRDSSVEVWLGRMYSSWSRRLEDVFWRRRWKASLRRLQDVFIKMNVCWEFR